MFAGFLQPQTTPNRPSRIRGVGPIIPNARIFPAQFWLGPTLVGFEVKQHPNVRYLIVNTIAATFCFKRFIVVSLTYELGFLGCLNQSTQHIHGNVLQKFYRPVSFEVACTSAPSPKYASHFQTRLLKSKKRCSR